MSTLQLLLLRHGKAENGPTGLPDHDRQLASRGRLNARDQAHAFRPATADGMLVSSAKRTQQTADILIETWTELGTPASTMPIRRDTPQGYLASAHQWMSLIAMEQGASRLWIVAHNPGISELVMLLTGQNIGMTTADIVQIHLDLATWVDIAPGQGQVTRHRTGRGV